MSQNELFKRIYRQYSPVLQRKGSVKGSEAEGDSDSQELGTSVHSGPRSRPTKARYLGKLIQRVNQGSSYSPTPQTNKCKSQPSLPRPRLATSGITEIDTSEIVVPQERVRMDKNMMFNTIDCSLPDQEPMIPFNELNNYLILEEAKEFTLSNQALRAVLKENQTPRSEDSKRTHSTNSSIDLDSPYFRKFPNTGNIPAQPILRTVQKKSLQISQASGICIAEPKQLQLQITVGKGLSLGIRPTTRSKVENKAKLQMQDIGTQTQQCKKEIPNKNISNIQQRKVSTQQMVYKSIKQANNVIQGGTYKSLSPNKTSNPTKLKTKPYVLLPKRIRAVQSQLRAILIGWKTRRIIKCSHINNIKLQIIDITLMLSDSSQQSLHGAIINQLQKLKSNMISQIDRAYLTGNWVTSSFNFSKSMEVIKPFPQSIDKQNLTTSGIQPEKSVIAYISPSSSQTFAPRTFQRTSERLKIKQRARTINQNRTRGETLQNKSIGRLFVQIIILEMGM